MMQQRQPTISVVVPLYNKAGFVEEALASILNQTCQVQEIIVIDDGSTDGGGDRVEAMGCSTVRLIRQSNAGVSAARNAGIEAAKGDFIAFLDADDRYLPDFLQTIMALASEYPQACLLGSAYRRFCVGADGGMQCLPVMPRLPQRGIVKDFYSAWCRGSFFFTSSIVVKSVAFMESGIRFPVGERLGEDQDVWFRLAERYPVAFEPSIHAEYRVGVPGSAMASTSETGQLPSYCRLSKRVQQNLVPATLVRGARRLVASHLLNVARARMVSGKAAHAWMLVQDGRVLSNPGYLIRTVFFLLNQTIRPKGMR